ncbi:nucleotidyltransferase family protein [Shewanella sp. WXL01]|uniref:N-acetylmuramate alpha-1-phosphate uridylyltransferase MurU n=1 Tax=Shewanella sp. WXL01 TaxID=2709721 RepID=UPI0014385ED2|nr:nucleotidyltransferase family protein [Shewanella sp. WXL01]
MKVMILAAGRGERLRPLTDSCPKPLVEVNGKPLIEYHLEKLAKAGVAEVVINCAWQGHMLPETLGDGSRWGLSIQYSHESQALETAGGIKQALPLLGAEPFLVINGDIYIDDLPDFDRALTMLNQQGKQMFLWLVTNPEHHPSGDFSVNEGALSYQADNKFTFSGMGIYHPCAFDSLEAGKAPLGPLMRVAMDQKQVIGQLHSGYWCDVGTTARLAEVAAHIQMLKNES